MVDEIKMPIITNKNEMIEQSMVILLQINEKIRGNILTVREGFKKKLWNFPLRGGGVRIGNFPLRKIIA